MASRVRSYYGADISVKATQQVVGSIVRDMISREGIAVVGLAKIRICDQRIVRAIRKGAVTGAFLGGAAFSVHRVHGRPGSPWACVAFA